jgi:uncharacterized phage-associated protein
MNSNNLIISREMIRIVRLYYSFITMLINKVKHKIIDGKLILWIHEIPYFSPVYLKFSTFPKIKTKTKTRILIAVANRHGDGC